MYRLYSSSLLTRTVPLCSLSSLPSCWGLKYLSYISACLTSQVYSSLWVAWTALPAPDALWLSNREDTTLFSVTLICTPTPVLFTVLQTIQGDWSCLWRLHFVQSSNKFVVKVDVPLPQTEEDKAVPVNLFFSGCTLPPILEIELVIYAGSPPVQNQSTCVLKYFGVMTFS